MIRLRGVLCDIGGVLTLDQWSCVADILAPRLGTSREGLLALFRKASREVDLGALSIRELSQRIPGSAKGSLSLPEFEDIVLHRSLQLNRTNLAQLRSAKNRFGLRTVSVSNVGPEIAAALDRILELSSVFDSAVRSFELGVLKPSPDIFEAAIRRAELRREELLFLDDLEENVRAADRLGLPSMRVDLDHGVGVCVEQRLAQLAVG
jgi:HAD superfamily hydrolase (TIGR01509 family)